MSTLSSEQRKELEATYRQLIGAVKAMARLLELPDPIAPRHERRKSVHDLDVCDTLEAMHACVPVVQVVADANR